MFFRQGGPKGTKNFHGVPPIEKKHKISLSYFQMCLMARLKALGILRWNLGSDIKLHDLRSSAMVLIDVSSHYDCVLPLAGGVWSHSCSFLCCHHLWQSIGSCSLRVQ